MIRRLRLDRRISYILCVVRRSRKANCSESLLRADGRQGQAVVVFSAPVGLPVRMVGRIRLAEVNGQYLQEFVPF
jgi:hypothetical protein